MEGRNAREAQDVDVGGAVQFVGDPSVAGYRTLSGDITPLWGPFSNSDSGGAGFLGPGEYAARRLLADNAGAAVVLVPTFRGSTYLVGGGQEWLSSATPGAGGPLFENMVAQANLAYATCQSAYPGRPIQVRFFWVQGEFDASVGISRTAYLAALQDLIARARARITGAAAAPFVIGSMVPERWHPASANRDPAYIQINAAHVDASFGTGVLYARGPDYVGGEFDNLHYKPQQRARDLGTALAAALSDAVGPNMTSAAATGTVNGSRLAYPIAADGGADAARFEISDRYFTPTLRWAGDGNGPAVGSYTVGVRARDGAGRYGPTQTVTVTVAAAYGIGDQGPITAQYLGSATAAGTNTNATVDFSIPTIAGLNLLCFNSGGGGGDVGSVSSPGCTSLVVRWSGGTGGCYATVHALICPSAGTRTVTAVQSAVSVDLSVDVTGLTGTKATVPAATFDGANANPPWSTSAVTVPPGGMAILLGQTPATSRTVSGGATALSGAATGFGGRGFAAKRTATGSTGIDGGGGIYFVTTVVFEKSA